MPGHIQARKIFALWLLAFHDDNINMFGALEERHRIGDGSCRRTATVPTGGNVAEVDWSLMNVGHK